VGSAMLVAEAANDLLILLLVDTGGILRVLEEIHNVG
jgi:hypothetical protein